MNPEKFYEAERLQNIIDGGLKFSMAYRERHPEYKRLDFPNNFYFKILHDRQKIHWAIIVKEEHYSIYFINVVGQAFDKLEFKSYKIAKRQLRKNKFLCHSNARCPYLPIRPIFVNLNFGKKSAPYSRGKNRDNWDKNIRVIEEKPQRQLIKQRICTREKTDIWKMVFDVLHYIWQLIISVLSPFVIVFLLCWLLAMLFNA